MSRGLGADLDRIRNLCFLFTIAALFIGGKVKIPRYGDLGSWHSGQRSRALCAGLLPIRRLMDNLVNPHAM